MQHSFTMGSRGVSKAIGQIIGPPGRYVSFSSMGWLLRSLMHCFYADQSSRTHSASTSFFYTHDIPSSSSPFSALNYLALSFVHKS